MGRILFQLFHRTIRRDRKGNINCIMNSRLRLATKKDAQLIAEISQLTFRHTFAPMNTKEDMDIFLNEQFTKGRLMLEVGAPGNIFYLAYLGEEVAGYMKLRTGYEPPTMKKANAMELARLYTMPGMVGKGIGALMMRQAIETAKENGHKRLWLGVWEKNQRAIDFYTKWGFKRFGETDFLLGNDVQIDWLMQKPL